MRQIDIPQKIIDIARKEAEKSNVRRAKVSALVLDKKLRHIIAKAHNTLCMDNSTKFTIHAEEAVILKTRRDLNNLTIFVYRRKKIGAGTSKPCCKCAKLLEIAGTKRVIYMDNHNDFVLEQM